MKIGTKVKIVNAGEGAWAANGHEAIVVSKKEALSSQDYGGQWRGAAGTKYVKLTNLNKRTKASPKLYTGLCPGFKLQKSC